MDTLVARHTRSAFEEDVYGQDEQEQDLSFTTPALSLKFALPPTSNVSEGYLSQEEYQANVLSLATIMAPVCSSKVPRLTTSI